MTFYRNILKQGWELTWRNKYLWFFGIFAALLGNGGEFEIFYNMSSDPSQALFPSWERIASTGVFSSKTYANIVNLFQQDALSMMIWLVVVLVIIAVLILLIWLAVASQAAIVGSSAAAIKQKKNSLKDGRNIGVLNFWPVLFLNILTKAVIYILLAIISLPILFSSGGAGFGLLYVLIFIIAIFSAVIFSFIMKYAIAYVVVNKMKVGQALQKSWRLFKANWLVSLELAVILSLINLLVGLALILIVLALAVPFVFLGLIFYYALAAIGSWLVAALALAAFLLITITCGAALAVFQIATWTSLFLELEKGSGESKLARIANGLIKAN